MLALIGTAINLYLLRVDASRTRVEEAQLARSILAMIADDIRATTVYKPQDTSAIAQLMASGTPFDVDSIDDERAESSEFRRRLDASHGRRSVAATSFSRFGQLLDLDRPRRPASTAENELSMPLGLSGTLNELYVDVTRLPRHEELFSTVTGYTNAPLPMPTGGMASVSAAAAGAMTPSDLKTVRYFVRPGEQVGSGSIAATSLAPELQLRAGGLVRQEITAHDAAICRTDGQFGVARIRAGARSHPKSCTSSSATSTASKSSTCGT